MTLAVQPTGAVLSQGVHVDRRQEIIAEYVSLHSRIRHIARVRLRQNVDCDITRCLLSHHVALYSQSCISEV